MLAVYEIASRIVLMSKSLLSAIAAVLSLGAAQMTPAVRVDQSGIFRDVETLASDAMEGRMTGTPGGEKARAYVLGRLKEAGVAPIGDAFERPFTFASRGQDQRKGVNLVGVIRGTRVPDRYIVLTAHYDHIGVRNGQVFNGADDNASGVAALLAAATYFSRTRPEHSLIIAAMDAEEAGLQGARAFMRDPPVPVSSMIVNVNMDMVGRDPDNKLFAIGVHYYPYLKPYLEKIAQPPVVLAFGHDTPGEQEDWTRDSDHYAFYMAGIPWIYFGVEDFDQHHKATDDAATIGRAFLAGAAATVIAAVREFDAHLEQIADQRTQK
jgi:Zn-dependent M28 family amino/carboxypeptidase